jgi:threonylcarbamoyladenosine tRNA methylthiotransferase MtaB
MENRPTVTFRTLGCKLNQAETEFLAWQFAEAGSQVVEDDRADICVLNTCTVTHIADRKSRHFLRLLRKKNPNSLLVATGCYAERSPRDLVKIGVDIVAGNKQKSELVKLVMNNFVTWPCHSNVKDLADGESRVRSFIKIQDGCNDFCAYCIVPMMRGREYCLPVAEVIDVVKARVSAGAREVVLTGTKIGTYNYNGTDLHDLVRHILDETHVERVHLSSLQPQEISARLLSLWADSRLCRHFHLALQSGSDTVLKRMGRCYTVADYSNAVSLVHKFVPGAAVTTDIIVGFPGESDTEFEESYRVCRETGFADMHVFTYSMRPGTSAAEMAGQVGDKQKKARSQRMLTLTGEIAGDFGRRFFGQTVTVLWENEVTLGTGVYSGLSDNYIRPHEHGLWAEMVI